MARKNQHPKTAARGRKAPDGKPRAGREGVAKAKTAAKAPPKRAPAPAPASPPAPKVKFRGRVLENEPLARYTTYRIGGPARAPRRPPRPHARGRAPPPAPTGKSRGRVLENEPLARYTTSRIGGPARYLVQPADADDVVKALDLAQARGLPWFVLGLGSNLLVKDTGFPGVVIRCGKGLDRFEMKGATAIVGAGLPTPLLARRTAEAGVAGGGRLIGGPGTVGR